MKPCRNELNMAKCVKYESLNTDVYRNYYANSVRDN